MPAIGTMGEGIDEGELRKHLAHKQDREQAEVPHDSAERDVQSALEEEERRQEGECDHAQALLLLAVLRVMAAHDQAEYERR